MKTTELFVEQVLIGLAVLVTAALLISPDVVHALFEANLGAVAVLAGGAYVVGILYDRLGDTLLGDLEQHHRLRFARDELVRQVPVADPFPEDKYRVLTQKSDAPDHAHYLRSRIRLTRAMATLAPSIVLAVVLYVSAAGPAVRQVGAGLIVIAYAIVWSAKQRTPAKLPPKATELDRHRRYRLPRTDRLHEEWISRWYRERFGERNPLFLDALIWWGGSVLALAAGVLCLIALDQKILLRIALSAVTVACSMALSGLFGWSWWRITETYYTFLRDYHEFTQRAEPPATGAAAPSAQTTTTSPPEDVPPQAPGTKVSALSQLKGLDDLIERAESAGDLPSRQAERLRTLIRNTIDHLEDDDTEGAVRRLERLRERVRKLVRSSALSRSLGRQLARCADSVRRQLRALR